MLKSVRLKNFKLHEDTSIEAAPITVFIGPNNSGKSSIFQALLALRQAAQRGDSELLKPAETQRVRHDEYYQFGETEIVDIGGFNDVVRHGQSTVEIGLSGSIHPTVSLPYGAPVDANFDVTARENKLVYHRGCLRTGRAEFSWQWAAPDESPPASIQLEDVTVHFAAYRNFRLIRTSGYSQGTANPKILQDAVAFADFLGQSPILFLRSLHPIPPLRGFEQSGSPLPDGPAANLERLTIADRAMALSSVLAYDPELEERLSRRLEELLQIRLKVKLLPGKRVTIWAKKRDKKAVDKTLDNFGEATLFTNEGTGANQLPFILIPIGLTPPNETILLSEPEAHLHPKAQCELTRMLLAVAKKENIQFFIETHSEHVLHVILNAIGKHEWEPSQVAIYSFENVNGTARAIRLEVDEQGGVKGGLPGFFDQSLDELTEYLETLKKPSA